MTPPSLSPNAAALKLTGQIAANPALAPALIEMLEAAGGDPERLAALTHAALKGIEAALPEAPSAADKLIPNAGRKIDLNGSPAIEMHVSLPNGESIRAVLSDAVFDKSRPDQVAFAQQLGGRLATMAENDAVVDELLKKETQGTLNTAEIELLITYRQKHVRDSVSLLSVCPPVSPDVLAPRYARLSADPRRDPGFHYGGSSMVDRGYPGPGALIVLPLEE